MAARWRATGCRAAPSRSRAGHGRPGANYTDLIARSVEVNAGIWARQLQVTAGGNEVSVDHARVQKTAASGDAPAFALDVGALGGMYSQKIVLVGTEHGVGMRNAGAIGAQAGQLVVTVDGRLESSGTMQARTDTRIDASGGLANAGTISAGRELAVNTPQDIDNRQGTLNARRISVDARSLRNRDGTIEQTGLQDLALRAVQASNRDGGRIGLSAADAGTPADKETSRAAAQAARAAQRQAAADRVKIASAATRLAPTPRRWKMACSTSAPRSTMTAVASSPAVRSTCARKRAWTTRADTWARTGSTSAAAT